MSYARLIDKSFEGLTLLVVQVLAEAIIEIRTMGVIISVADKNAGFCQKIADRRYIIERRVIRYQDVMEKIW